MVDSARSSSFLIRLYDGLVNRSDVQLAMGNAEQALALLDEADSLFEANLLPGYDHENMTVRARALAQLGRHQEAEEIVDKAVDLLGDSTSGMPVFATLESAACVAAERGQFERASQLLGAARSGITRSVEFMHLDFRAKLDTLEARLREAVGSLVFEAAAEAGATLVELESVAALLRAATSDSASPTESVH